MIIKIKGYKMAPGMNNGGCNPYLIQKTGLSKYTQIYYSV
jgi:hypothetical protein